MQQAALPRSLAHAACPAVPVLRACLLAQAARDVLRDTAHVLSGLVNVRVGSAHVQGAHCVCRGVVLGRAPVVLFDLSPCCKGRMQGSTSS